MAAKSQPQKVVVDDQTYLWSMAHEHKHGHSHVCHEVFTAFLNGKNQAPLRVYFTEEEGARLAAGGLVLGKAKTTIALQDASAVRAIIEAGRIAGWQPESARQPFAIASGVALLEDVLP